MKRQIRCGVFETNSSMTHALTICTEEEYNKWQNGDTLFNEYDNEFITMDDETIAELKAEYESSAHQWYNTFEEYLSSEGINSYDTYNDEGYFEEFKKSFTTPSGDRMVAFGYYGHDY